MTALAYGMPTKDFIPGMAGSSVSWSRFAANPTRRSTKGYDLGWFDDLSRPQMSNGVTVGATTIQHLVQQLMDELREWSMQHPSTLTDVEQEVAVLMPPKRERTVTVHLHHAGRARPLVNFDDMIVEPE